jgi:drug/metabolite transporter (DMT)-like permease
VNTSPIFSSVLAVSLLDEVWTVQNVIGTCLVILGVVILSSDRATQGQWRKSDILILSSAQWHLAYQRH